MKMNRKKLYGAILYSVIGLILMGFIVFSARLNETVANQRKDFENKKEAIMIASDAMRDEQTMLMFQYDALYGAKNDAVGLLEKTIPIKLDTKLLREFKDVMHVENCILIDKNGKLLAAAVPTSIDFTSARFNQLRAVVTAPERYEPMTVEFPDQALRFYATKVRKDLVGIICVNTYDIEANIANNTSLEAELSQIHLGKDGFVLAVNARDYSFVYAPNPDLVGKNAIVEGWRAEDFVDGFEGYTTIQGQKLFTSIIEKGGIFYVMCVPKTEIVNANYPAAIGGMLLLGSVMAVLIVYFIFLMNERTDITETIYVKEGFFDESLAKKTFFPVMLCVLVVFGCSYYLQMLVNLSRQSVISSARIEKTMDALTINNYEKERLEEEYNQNYLEKCELAAYIVQKVEKTKPLTREFMQELNNALLVNEIWYLDTEGKTIASDQEFWSWKISDDKEQPSHEFKKILNGEIPYLIQDTGRNSKGEGWQYIGMAMLDENHHTQGLMEIVVDAGRLFLKLYNNSMSAVLGRIKVGNSGFAFAVKKEDETFEYFPDFLMVNEKVTDYGMRSSQIKPGFNDFITIDHETYYCTSAETDEDCVYIAVPYRVIKKSIFIIAFLTALYSAIVLLFLWYYLCYFPTGSVIEAYSKKKDDKFVDVTDGSGRVVKTTSFLSRFNRRSSSWRTKNAGQKMAHLVKYLISVLSLIMIYVIVNVDKVLPEDSLLRYIISGTWQKGINIFSVTFCVIAIIVINVVVIMIRDFLEWISGNANAQAITIIRLINNSLKFAAVIGSVYYCLGVIGVDTKALMTSAGILTLIVGLGANSLVNDIISGLFLILEGEFQVGDIVTIDGFRGTVLEIGIRTIKVQEGSGNVKVISNRNASNVLNMTKNFSVVAIDMSIEYGEKLEYVEYVLMKEFPEISKKLPAITDGPSYKGVSALGESGVDIKIICKCKEQDRMQLDRDLRRELKLVFDRYGINIPYPQMVINNPHTKFHHVPKNEKLDENSDAVREELIKPHIIEEENEA